MAIVPSIAGPSTICTIFILFTYGIFSYMLHFSYTMSILFSAAQIGKLTILKYEGDGRKITDLIHILSKYLFTTVIVRINGTCR